MVRLRCEKCNNDAAVVSLIGYTETYLCEICEKNARQPSAKNTVPYRQLANVMKPDARGDPLVCGKCKVYCWRCNEYAEKEGDDAPRFLVFGVQLQGATMPEMECYDAQAFYRYWNVESDSDSILIESPQGAIPTMSVNSNLISNGSGEMRSWTTSKSNDTNETIGMVPNDYPSESDVVEGMMPEGVVEGVPCGTIPVSELPGYKRNRNPPVNGKLRKRKCIKGGGSSSGGTEPGGNPTQRRCMHCGVLKTPQWRAGPSGQKTLCNACGVKYKAGRLSARAARGAASSRGRGRGRARKHHTSAHL